MKKLYKARWAIAGQPSLGSVDVEAKSDEVAIQKFDKIAHEIGLPNTPRTIMCEGRVVQSLTRGCSEREY